jgi:hypothetical protein
MTPELAAKARLIRVFPRRTKATPTGALVRIGGPDLFGTTEADGCHVSCTFTWDLPSAEQLAEAWSRYLPTTLGGPACGTRGEGFEPGIYLREGYTITSRGCPNHCWFCNVWRRDGDVRELPIRDGYNILDDNLLACSEAHIRAVFAMLKRQPRRAEFTGGLEAARLQLWHVDLLADLRPKQMFFALDDEDDRDPLLQAGRMLSGIWPLPTSHVLRCYVLIGYPQDTMAAAEDRLRFALSAGFMPMAMLYRDERGEYDPEWRRFQREWANPTILGTKCKEATL